MGIVEGLSISGWPCLGVGSLLNSGVRQAAVFGFGLADGPFRRAESSWLPVS